MKRMLMDTVSIDDLEQNSFLKAAFFLVRSKETLNKRSGEPYLRFLLSDGQKSIKAVMWDNVAHVSNDVQPGIVVKVQGTVTLYQNELQITIHRLRAATEDEANLSDFLPRTDRDIDEQCDVTNGKFRLVLLIDTAANAVELWEWQNPALQPAPVTSNRFTSPGFFEIGLMVDDLDEAEKRLTEKGYSFANPVWEFCKGRGLFGGAYGKVRYIYDPDGVRIELVQLILEDEPGL